MTEAVAGGAGRAQRSRAPLSDTALASGAIATGAGAGADTGRRGGGERAPTSGARSTAYLGARRLSDDAS